MEAYRDVLDEARNALREVYHAEVGQGGWYDVKNTEVMSVMKVDSFRGRDRDCTRTCAVVHAPVHVAVYYLTNTELRREYDAMMDKIEEIEVIDKATKLMHKVNKSPNSWLVTPRDFCLINRLEKWKDGEVAILVKSCEHDKCPEQKGYVRGLTLLNGFVLKDLNTTPPSFQLVFAVQFDPQGKIPDMIIKQMGGKIASMIETIKDKIETFYQQEEEKKSSGQDPGPVEEVLATLQEIEPEQ